MASATTQFQGTLPATSKRAAVAVFALVVVLYLGSAFSPHLQDDADSTHAEAAREMLVRGDYVTLKVNGIRYLEKAPLMYWAVAFSYRLFGTNAFATRLPTAIAMFLLVLLAVRWGERAYGRRTGLYAGLFVCTTAGYYLFTRILIPEAILSLFIAAVFYFYATALEDRRAWRWYAGYACLALAVLTKGLLPLVVVGGTAAFYVALSGEWRRWREFRLGLGLLLFFAIATPWHLLAGFRNHGFFWFYFVNEHFLRFLGERYPKDYNKLPAALYWALHLIWLFPWSLYLPVVVRRLWRQFRGKAKPASGLAARTELLCFLWAGVILVFFAFSTNQEYYTVPAYFPVLMLLAAAVAGEEDAPRSRWLAASAGILAVLSLAVAGILAFGLWESRHLPFVPDIGRLLTETNLADYTLSMGHMMDLTWASFAALRLPAILAAIALAIGPALAFVMRRRARQVAATWATALTMASFLIAAHVALERFDPYLSSGAMAKAVAPVIAPGDRVMIYGDQAYGSSLLFYLKRPIELVNGRSTSMWFGSTFPDAPPIFLDNAGLLRAWNSGRRVFLLVPPHLRVRVDGLLATRYLLAQSSGKVLYSNRPSAQPANQID